MSRFSVLGGKMVKTSAVKNRFSQLNGKRFYFPDGVVSLPFYYPILSEIDEFKNKEKVKKLRNIYGKKDSFCFVQKKRH